MSWVGARPFGVPVVPEEYEYGNRLASSSGQISWIWGRGPAVRHALPCTSPLSSTRNLLLCSRKNIVEDGDVCWAYRGGAVAQLVDRFRDGGICQPTSRPSQVLPGSPA